MKTFIDYFNIILLGDQNESSKAARQVRKFLYSSESKGKYKVLASIVENAPKEYENIIEDWRRENFVIAVSVLYFLHNKENRPDFLFSWLCDLIQDPNGNIRHAAVRMFEHELGPLTYHIRFPNEKSNYLRKLSSEQSDRILFEMFANLMNLIKYLWKPVFKKYRYVSSLPSGPYKSIQMVLGHLVEDCGEEYMKRLEKSFDSPYPSTY